MYCENCQREVASTKNPHTGLLQCSHCGTEKRSTVADANSSIAETAHALLKRWEQSRGQAEQQAPAPKKSQPLSIEDALSAQPPVDSESETYGLNRSEPEQRRTNSGSDITAELLENADELQAELAAASHREQNEYSTAPAYATAEKRESVGRETQQPKESAETRFNREFEARRQTAAAPTSRNSESTPPAPQLISNSPREAEANHADETYPRDDRHKAETQASYKDALLESLQADDATSQFDSEPKPSQRSESKPAAPQFEQLADKQTTESSVPVRADKPSSEKTMNHESPAERKPQPESRTQAESRPQSKPAAAEPVQAKRAPRQGQVRFTPPAGQDVDFDVQQAIERHHRKQRNWSAIIGQLLALAGAVCMTGGIAVVIGNRFGSLEVAETTGWLAMAGGHLLFILGIYTHLTSRVEQIWHDVHQRSDELARILLQQQRSQQMLYRATSQAASDDEYGMDDSSFERKQLTRSS